MGNTTTKKKNRKCTKGTEGNVKKTNIEGGGGIFQI